MEKGATKMAEFTPITTQEQLDKVIGERIAGVKAKYEGFDDYKKKAEDYLNEYSKHAAFGGRDE